MVATISWPGRGEGVRGVVSARVLWVREGRDLPAAPQDKTGWAARPNTDAAYAKVEARTRIARCVDEEWVF